MSFKKVPVKDALRQTFLMVAKGPFLLTVAVGSLFVAMTSGFAALDAAMVTALFFGYWAWMYRHARTCVHAHKLKPMP